LQPIWGTHGKTDGENDTKQPVRQRRRRRRLNSSEMGEMGKNQCSEFDDFAALSASFSQL
jgi:hypothetical protein